MSREPSVSACLLSWRRPRNLPRIVERLLAEPYIDEILIWNNERRTSIPVEHPKVRVLQSSENLVCLGRYACARHARNRIVYVQDDDAILRNLRDLYHAFLADPTRIAHALGPSHFARRRGDVHGTTQVALVGWGAFFLRDWVTVLDDVPEDVRRRSLFRREADRYFSMLLERRHTTIRADFRHLEGHSTPGVALWRDPAHTRSAALAVRDGLRLVRTRRAVEPPVPWNVVIVRRGDGPYLRDAVDSVLRTPADYALTIVDDACGDRTADVATALADEHSGVVVMRNATPRGVGFARNRGIGAVNSTYVVVLDADDRLGAGYLPAAERALAKGADIVNPDALVVGERPARWVVPDRVSLAMLRRRNRIHYCAAFRRSYWSRIGGFDTSLPSLEDYDFWLRMLAVGARVRPQHGDHFFYRRRAVR